MIASQMRKNFNTRPLLVNNWGMNWLLNEVSPQTKETNPNFLLLRAQYYAYHRQDIQALEQIKLAANNGSKFAQNLLK